MSLTALVMLYNSSMQDDFMRQLSYQVLKNVRDVPELSSYELAERCFASSSAIRKLAKELGYPSYSDFRAAIRWQLAHYTEIYRHQPADIRNAGTATLNALVGNVRTLLEQLADDVSEEKLDHAVQLLMENRKVCFFTTKGSPQQSNLQTDLILLGKDTSVYTVLHGTASGIEQADCDTVTIFTKMDLAEPNDIFPALQATKEKGASTILITNAYPAREMKFCDAALHFRGSASIIDMYAMDLIQQMLSLKLREYLTI